MTRAAASLRIARPGDLTEVESVLASSYPALMAGAYEPALLAMALPSMTRAQPHLLASGRYWIAGTPAIGCGGWSAERPGTPEMRLGLGHIRHFAVRPDCVGQGIGRALLDACIRQARDCSIDRFECWSSLNAEPFYAALGFAVRERTVIEMGAAIRFPVVCMTRTL